METNSEEHVRLVLEQRAAYNAWQAAPAGSGDSALREYERASEALREFHERNA